MIALIAGTGMLPLKAAAFFLTNKKQFFIICLSPQDNHAQLREQVGSAIEIIALPFYKISTILDELKKRKTTHLFFIGKVDKRNLFKKFKLDWLFIKLAAQIWYRSDKAIMELIIRTLAQHSIKVLSQKDILHRLMVSSGILTGTLTCELEQNITVGINLARTISLHDIGQTVVIKKGIILAVEAIEGTDNCIKRGIDLGKKDVIICKATRHDQNKKYDLPTLGSASLTGIKKGQVAAIAWQSDQTLITDVEIFIRRAQELGITLVSI